MSDQFGVLISSAGRRVALLEIFRRTLRDMDLSGPVVAVDSSRLSGAFHAADDAQQVPPCMSADFVPAVLGVCSKFGVRLVVPTIDPELAVYAAHRDEFERAGVRVAVSGTATTAICEDKEQTHSWLVANGFPTVRQAPLDEFSSSGNGWRYPVVVKPRRGSASVGVSVISQAAELPAPTGRADFIVQSVASGSEYTIDTLVDGAGNCISAVPRRRLEVRSGESSKGVTQRSPLLEDIAVRVSESLPDAYGPLTIQGFLDSDTDELVVIEINARFGGGFPLAWHAGADHPRWLIEDALGLPGSASREAWRSGLVMLRYDDAVFIDSAEAGL